jgi:hypothetical protein
MVFPLLLYIRRVIVVVAEAVCLVRSMFVSFVLQVLFGLILVLTLFVWVQRICLLFAPYYPKSLPHIFIRLGIVEILGV